VAMRAAVSDAAFWAAAAAAWLTFPLFFLACS
jgi:hypothetical protein